MANRLIDEEIEFIVDTLRKGEALPEDLKYKLFPTRQREYELAYGGKMRKEDILANEDGVVPVPLQIEKIFNETRKPWADGWRNLIVFGDNLQFLKTCFENRDGQIANKVKGKVKLIYIDPPFATESDFKSKTGQTAYKDKTKGADFVEFLRRRLIVAREILADDGCIFVHLDQRKIHYVKVLMDEIFGENNFRNEIVWKRTGAHSDSGKFGVNAEYILYYTKSEIYTWNPLFSEYSAKHLKRFKRKDEAGRQWTDSPLTAKGLSGGGYSYTYKGVEGLWRCPKTTMEKLDADGLLYFTSKGGIRVKKYLDELDGMPLQAIWTDIDPINSQSPERIGYPTQKPEKLIERIISVSTNEGDLVMDFFAGSGTVAAVAEKLNRKWVVCDIGKLSFYSVQKRLLNIEQSKDLNDGTKKYLKAARSFITMNTGHYDLEKIFKLEEDKYRSFVLDLFEMTPTPKKRIGGVEIDGERNDGFYCHIFPYWKHKDASVDEDYLQSLHESLGKKVGSRFYIIAPVNYVDFISDYLQIDKVRYYFLKVPYHIIKELHKAQFKKFRQPQSPKNVNALEDAIGFHFMRQPNVVSRLQVRNGYVQLKLKEFRSHATEEATGRELQNFESLSMILIDTNYDGQAFSMTCYYFAADLIPKKKAKKSADDEAEDVDEIASALLTQEELNIPELERKSVGDLIMVIYVDIYGNEFKETLQVPKR